MQESEDKIVSSILYIVYSKEEEKVGANCIRPHKVEARRCRVFLVNTARRVATND